MDLGGGSAYPIGIASPRVYALGVDFSTVALHVTYGAPNETPHYTHLRLKSALPEDRIAEVIDKFGLLLRQIEERWGGFEFSVMAIERPFMRTNARTVVSLSQVQATCMCVSLMNRWYPVEQDPSAIRKAVLGRGSGKKGEMKQLAQAWVLAKHGLTLDEDQSDSMIIWEFAVLQARRWLQTQEGTP